MNKEKIKKQVIADMESMGVYRVEYREAIDIFAGMLEQYKSMEQQFRETGFRLTEEHTNRVGATNERKTPIYMALEKLRKDLATYSTLLCLNPKQVGSLTTEVKKQTSLTEMIEKMER